MTWPIIPPGSIPATTPPGEGQRALLTPPSQFYPPLGNTPTGAPGLGPGVELQGHQHPQPASTVTPVVTWYGFSSHTQDFSGIAGNYNTFGFPNDPGFDPVTGIFTASVKGLYNLSLEWGFLSGVDVTEFHAFIINTGGPDSGLDIGERFNTLPAGTRSWSISASATLVLDVGTQVYVQWGSTPFFGNAARGDSFFNGVLLQAI